MDVVKEKSFWQKLYDTEDYVYGKEPLPFLKKCQPRLPKGKILDLAMGEGQNAIFLASQGYDVTGFDVSEPALKKARELSQKHQVSLEIKNQNLDFYIFPPMAFHAICMFHYKPASRFYGDINKALRPGGMFICEGYLSDSIGQQIHGVELTHKTCFQPNELLKNLPDLRILHYEENAEGGLSIVRCLAHKPTDKDAIRFGLATTKKEVISSHQKRAESLFKPKK